MKKGGNFRLFSLKSDIMEKAIFCWSGGKDSSLCLYEVLKSGEYKVAYLLTTLNENFKRISMHGVQEALLEEQSRYIGIPLKKVYVKEGSNEEYERNMEKLLLEVKAEGINNVIFGDILLEDLRQYRETNLAKVGMKAVFPLWQRNTDQLIKTFISLGFKTITCCVNDDLGKAMVGAEIDSEFVDSLPGHVDPCGENGEFHTFCYDGPIFKSKIKFTKGEKVFKPLELRESDTNLNQLKTKGFWYCDLIPE